MEPVEVEASGGVWLRADAVGDPTARPVALFHGGGQTRHAWHSTLAALGESGWRAYSFDLRGHGQSDWAPDADYSLDAFAADIVAVARRLGGPALVGASLGGLASMLAVGEHTGAEPLATALVMVDVAPRIEPGGAERIAEFMRTHLDAGFGSLDEVADAIQEFNPHRPRPTDLSGLTKNVRQHEDGRWYWHWDPQFVRGPMGSPDESRALTIQPERLQAAARSLALPTLLVRGRMSDILSEEGAREMLELAPHAAYVDVAGAGHMVAGDRNDAFNQAVVDFLAAAVNPARG